MVRKYKRKTEKTDPDAINHALVAIRLGMSVRAAAREFRVGFMSLQRRNAIAKGQQNRVQAMTEIDSPTEPIAVGPTSSTPTAFVPTPLTRTAVVPTQSTSTLVVPTSMKSQGGQTVILNWKN